ncbi:MAG: hypothetical protein JW894_04290 [Bacteroidales bacterium]|nr:hypothetical protein [Bacteroidales bacterium]
MKGIVTDKPTFKIVTAVFISSKNKDPSRIMKRNTIMDNLTNFSFRNYFAIPTHFCIRFDTILIFSYGPTIIYLPVNFFS